LNKANECGLPRRIVGNGCLDTHPIIKIDGNAGIMRVSRGFLGSCGALETASIPLEGLKSLQIPANIRYQ
jgi:hypothetical protein